MVCDGEFALFFRISIAELRGNKTRKEQIKKAASIEAAFFIKVKLSSSQRIQNEII